MKKVIANLFKIKSIITLALTAALIYGFIVGTVSSEVFIPYVTMVLTFYFNKDKNKEEE